MLKATRLSDLALKAFKVNNNEVVEVGDKTNRIVENLSKKLKIQKLDVYAKYWSYMEI